MVRKMLWTDTSRIYILNVTAYYSNLQNKCKQIVKNTYLLWHVYATPNNPSSCLILALSVYLFAEMGLTIDGLEVTQLDSYFYQ